ncbi:TerC/Alx family metal homeostasis membrane protein [Marivirga arenosa]|uniref:TerC/Alx family metal homeostasis membrane protein n=1 Tax=Marivirga arenosa TaxID=3059076 RepID=A0AA52F0D7_9BACT|nr:MULTISPECIES: TerC/Alx family metal homeostasis membrane protein [unclassified Marivirga]WMN07764.1 TerC/Alx family metal homeostasis membrane protein [Marivirga sp. ABR2-2]WNB18009.1 TerC/Alx family metal homeostasis membrane protein [Marivirga sp. BKB1-2]
MNSILEFFNNTEHILYTVFAVVIIIFLIFDLGFFNKKAKKVSLKSAAYQSVFWVVISIAFGYLIYRFYGGTVVMLEFFSAYVAEYALSVDNIFVILLILRYFKVDDTYYHKILFWGVLGAIIFRAIFIFLGAFLVNQFHWILYIFGAFLVYSGIKIFFSKEEDDLDPEKNLIIQFARKYLRITKGNFSGKFIIRRGRAILFTPLFLVILLVESTDLIFAVDSIPAVFAISQNEFILYTSNIFAILGLRAKFFLLAGIIDRFYLLQKGLSFILIFIGAKMLLEIFHIHINTFASFTVIFSTLLLSILLSLLIPQKTKSNDFI